MRIEWATVCLEAGYEEEGWASIRGVLQDAMEIGDGFPALGIELQVAPALFFRWDELEAEEHAVRWSVIGPDLTTLCGDGEEGFKVDGPGVRQPPGSEGHVLFPLVVTFDAHEPGQYQIQLRLADSLVTLPYYVLAV